LGLCYRSGMTRSALDSVPPAVAHRVSLLTDLPAGELLVHEIYRSLQGESTFAGKPCVFVRLSVCDSRCQWCDTPHAFTQGERMTRAAVRERVLAFDCPLVELTGGEPLLQPDALPLMVELCDAGRMVLIETSGAHDVSVIDPRVHVIMDLKCPDSGECDRNRWANLAALKPTDQIKFVIASRRDWDWTEQVVREHKLDERFEVLVSAVFDAIPLDELAALVLASGLNVRMQLQLHKYVWHPKARGV
jgi:7-carboxy-7-deazaguanine synthase